MVIDKEIIQQAFFQDDAFEATWMELKQEYETLGFKDDISDAEMIEEFKYIAQQLRKYKFSKQDQILEQDSVENMVKQVELLLGRAPEYGSSRKDIVYNFMRDHWLLYIYNTLSNVLMANNEEDENE